MGTTIENGMTIHPYDGPASTDTTSGVREATEDLTGGPIDDKIVADANAKPASSDETAVRFKQAEERLGKIEAYLDLVAPVVAQARQAQEAGGSTVSLTGTVNAILAALHVHFGGKMTLPQPVGVPEPKVATE
jgi:hypothetical protein